MLWIYPAMQLSWWYSGELISWLTTQDSLDWITSWNDLFGRVLQGSITPFAFKSGFITTDAALLLTSDVANHLQRCDTIQGCCDDLLGASSRLHHVWIDMSFDALRMLELAGAHSLRHYGIPPRGSSDKYFMDAEVYLVGAGEGRAQRLSGVVFSKHAQEVSAKFNFWILHYFKVGLMAYWGEKSLRDVIAVNRDVIAKRRLTARIGGAELHS